VVAVTAPIQGARLFVGRDVAVSDSGGAFALATLAVGRVQLRTRRVGYDERLDTLLIPARGGLLLTVQLNAAWSPTVDCEISVVSPQRRKKPWWKWWCA
jgi:hypothetical protein